MDDWPLEAESQLERPRHKGGRALDGSGCPHTGGRNLSSGRPPDPRPDYAIVRFSLADKVLGVPFDGYDPEVVSPVPVSLGRVELKKGTALLRLETVDANPKATANRYYWGLDCLVLTPVK